MKRVLTILTLVLGLHIQYMQGQQNNWQYYYDQLRDIDEETSEEDEEATYEILSEMAENPVNINTITRDRLEQMLFLNDNQIEAITNYIDKYGQMQSAAEWMMIPFLDENSRGLLRSLTFIGEPRQREYSVSDSIAYESAVKDYTSFKTDEGRGDLTFFSRVPFYNRVGNDDAYQGGKIKQWLRFNYKPTRHFRGGLLAAQDAGEPFFSDKNRYGYDFYSAYLQLQKVGRLKNLVVGHYRMKTGLGLILNNNYTFGKTFSLSSIQNGNTSLRPHSSRSESNYMQGAAATITLSRHLESSLFFSYRPVDATLTNDSCGIATLLKTGYHRTTSELNRKNNAYQSCAGANIRFYDSNLQVGFTALWNHYSIPLQPYRTATLSQLYRMFLPTGQDFWNASIDYSYKMGKKLRFNGETATGDCGRVATVNSASLRLSSQLSLMAIQRFYPYQFYATMGRSFSEGGSNQDESGIYVGATWTPNNRLSLTAYTDIAYFAWPKYEALGSSHSFDNLVQLTYKISSHSSLNMRYRGRMRQKDADKEKAGYQDGDLVYKNEQRLRTAYRYNNKRLTLTSQADVSFCHYKDTDFGWMLSQTATYRFKQVDITAGANYFNTSDYNARVFAYEQSTPYNLSFPSFFGKGCRLYSLADCNITKHLSAIAKIGFTHYFDRDHISSGYQRINSSTQTDLDIMIRWKL